MLKITVANSVGFHNYPSQTIVLLGHSEMISVLNTGAINTKGTKWPYCGYKPKHMERYILTVAAL